MSVAVEPSLIHHPVPHIPAIAGRLPKKKANAISRLVRRLCQPLMDITFVLVFSDGFGREGESVYVVLQ